MRRGFGGRSFVRRKANARSFEDAMDVAGGVSVVTSTPVKIHGDHLDDDQQEDDARDHRPTRPIETSL
jgi:hypothetical protein